MAAAAFLASSAVFEGSIVGISKVLTSSEFISIFPKFDVCGVAVFDGE